MVLDRALGGPRDEIELFDGRGLGCLDRILDQRLVDDRQHFLRHRLGRREDAGTETGHREDRLAHGFLHRAPRFNRPMTAQQPSRLPGTGDAKQTQLPFGSLSPSLPYDPPANLVETASWCGVIGVYPDTENG